MHRPASWHRTSDRHLAADLGRVGTLLVWYDPSVGTWSTSVLGSRRTGFMTAVAAQAAAIRLAREPLEEAQRKLVELGVVDATQSDPDRPASPIGPPFSPA